MNATSVAARLQGVSLTYGSSVALDDLTLDLPAGRMVGLIGPDGVGKSSLMSLLAGARVIQEGRIEVLAGNMADKRHRDVVCPRIAYMPQGLGKNLYPTLSVEENLQFFARLFGSWRRRAPSTHRRPDPQHWPVSFPRAPCWQALRRHETEARPVLCTDP